MLGSYLGRRSQVGEVGEEGRQEEGGESLSGHGATLSSHSEM